MTIPQARKIMTALAVWGRDYDEGKTPTFNYTKEEVLQAEKLGKWLAKEQSCGRKRSCGAISIFSMKWFEKVFEQ